MQTSNWTILSIFGSSGRWAWPERRAPAVTAEELEHALAERTTELRHAAPAHRPGARRPGHKQPPPVPRWARDRRTR